MSKASHGYVLKGKYKHIKKSNNIKNIKNIQGAPPAVAGTHAPGRGEGFEGFGRWLADIDIITAVSCCRGWKDQKTMPSGGKVDDTRSGLTHYYLINSYK